MSTFHNEQTSADGIHVIVRWEFDDLTERNNATGVPGGAYASTDDGGVARVGAAAPYNFYILRDGSTTPTPNTAWTNVGLGSGDVVGPGAGTATDEVCAYADAGGLTLKGSSKAVSSIPSTLPVPIGEGGTGMTTVAEARGALSEPIQGLMVVNQAYPIGAPEEGTEACPYKSIQAALNAIGAAVTSAEEMQWWEVRIAPGFYDEDLQIPALRTIWFNGKGGIVLADTSLTTNRQITVVSNTASLAGISHEIKITGFAMTGPIVLSSSTTVDHEFLLEDVNWINNPPQPCIDATGWAVGSELRLSALRSRFHSASGTVISSNTTSAAADVCIKRFTQCEVEGTVQCSGYGQIVSCFFGGGMSFLSSSGAISGSNLPHPRGFFDCTFDFGVAKTLSCQQPGDFYVDDVTWKAWDSDPANVLGGSGAFTAAPVTSLSDPFIDTQGASWVGSGPNSLKDAIDRIAAVIAANHGAIP